ncbi:MAG: glycosyltransferase family 4 protein [Planctomycetaceae bacterium]|nr:glycosyltransferase family 4 protein [Planctomycetaceae bacterium]
MTTDSILSLDSSRPHSDLRADEPGTSLRVLLASTERGWHGGEEQGRQLVQGLRARGHDCRIVALESGAFAQRMSNAGVQVYGYPRKGWNPRTLANIRTAVREFKPDVLHYNDAHAMTTIGLGSVWYPIPVRVCTRRVDYQISGSWHYNNLVDRVICISTVIADVCRHGGIHRDSIEIAHSGVDPDRMSGGNRDRGRKSLSCNDDQHLILSVATLTNHKGHRYLLEAMPEILNQFPDAILALAGDGDLTDALREQAGELGISDRVQFLGYRDDVPDLMAACDLFVIASHLEGLCTSIIDAMIAKRPIVATRAGGIPDLMGETFELEEAPVAWVAEPKSSRELCQAITAALTASPEEQQARIQKAYDRSLRLFTSDRMVEKNLRIYQKILHGKSAKAA